MKNAYSLLLLLLLSLTSCGQSDPNHQPKTAAKYQLTIGVQPSTGSRMAEVVPEVQEVLLQRIGQLGISYQSIEVDEEHGKLTLNLIDVPAEWGTGQTALENAQAQLLAKATIGFAQTYRINDPGISEAFLDYPLEALQAAGFQINDGNRSQAALGFTTTNELGPIDQLLLDSIFRKNLPHDLTLVWSAQKQDLGGQQAPALELYGLKLPPNGNYPLTEQHVAECSAYPDPSNGQVAINLTFNSDGGRIWGQMTTQASQNGNREIGIVLNDRVMSAPTVMSPILGGKSMITGNFTMEEAVALASQINLARLSHKITVLGAKQL